MHNPESVQENEMHNVPWEFEIQTDPLVLARRTVNKKENLPNCEFFRPGRPQSKIERKRERDEYQDLAIKLKKKL